MHTFLRMHKYFALVDTAKMYNNYLINFVELGEVG
jgi:hypothetical protein